VKSGSDALADTFVLSGTQKHSDKPSKLSILTWRLAYINGFVYLHLNYVTIGMRRVPLCTYVQSVIDALQMYDMII